LKFGQVVHLAQVLEHLVRLGFVHDAQGETDMHDHVIAHLDFGHEAQVGFLDHAPKAHLPDAGQIVIAGYAEHLTWNCEAHN